MGAFKVDKNGCWNWTGTTIRQGTRVVGPYRAVYEFLGRKVPKNLHLHHTCENEMCVNPDHLMPVTRAEHNKIHGKLRANSTHCRKGHELTEENIYHWRGYRNCRRCRANATAAHIARRGE